MKKILSMFLCLLMVVSVIPIIGLTASAATSGDFEYSILDDGTVEITKYKGSATILEIPSEIDGKTVTSIGERAFENCSSLKSVTIPDNITSIGDRTFWNCTLLTSIIIGNGVKSIGRCAFNDTGYYNDEKNWEDNVLYIGNYLILGSYYNYDDIYYGFSVSGNYSIKPGTKVIADSAFYCCTKLISVTIPDSITSISYGAFSGCSSLKTIVLPDCLTNIGNSAFYGTEYFNNKVNWENNVLYIDKYLISGRYSDYYNNQKKFEVSGNYSIKTGTKVIADCAFLDCTSLTSITIPDSVTCIGDRAFDNCSSNLTIYGYKNSEAERYAKKYNIKFADLNHTHSYTFKITKQPTCTEKGVKTYTCDCGESYTEEVSAPGHKEVVDKAVAPTCTKSGLTKGKHCSVCGKVLTAQKKISAQGHKIITLKTKKATYFSTGYKNRKICKVCKKVVNKGKTLKKLKLKVPTFTVKCIGKGKVKISWKKVKDATGIYIVYDTQKACNFPVGGTEIKGNKTSKVLKNLASCDHYFKAEAFIYKNGKYVSSERTKAIKVKVK